jgi:hypothetical protein
VGNDHEGERAHPVLVLDQREDRFLDHGIDTGEGLVQHVALERRIHEPHRGLQQCALAAGEGLGEIMCRRPKPCQLQEPPGALLARGPFGAAGERKVGNEQILEQGQVAEQARDLE